MVKMKKDLALKIIPFLKTEKQSLAIMEKTDYDRSVCEAGISLLQSEDQILFIMKMTGYAISVCTIGISLLQSEHQIFFILEKTGYDKSVWSAGGPLLKLETKTAHQLLTIMRISNYKDCVCETGISFLQSENQILFIMEKTNYDDNVCETGIPLLKLEEKTEDQLLAILEKNANIIPIVHKIVIPYLKLEEKTEDQLLTLLEKTNYHWGMYEFGIPFLRSKDRIVEIIERADFRNDVCETALIALQKIG